MRAWSLSLALAVLAIAGPANASEYLSSDSDDWYEYSSSLTGQTVRSQIAYQSGANWSYWENFAGLGDLWVYTYANNDWFWLYDGGSNAQLMPSPSQPVGTQRTIDIQPANRGAVTVGARGLTVTTGAGTFSNVTRLDLQTSAADAGVTSIFMARGIGIVRWTETSFAGPVEWDLEQAYVAGRRYTAAPVPAPTPTPTAQNRLLPPSEHAPQELILWGCNDPYIVVQTYADAWAALDGTGVRSQCIVTSSYVASQLRYEMSSRGVPVDDVEFLVANLDSVWMRDYGPVVLKNAATGERAVADLEYYNGRPNDDDFPLSYAAYRGWRVVDVPVSWEGGNFATDGQGLCFTSTGTEYFNNRLTRRQIESRIGNMGCDDFEWFTPLIDEGTTHIDMFARVLNDTTALVSSYPSSHRQHRVCNEAAAKFQARGYNVIRVEVDYTYDEFATYSNSVLANGLALIPVYENSRRNQAALDAYRSAGFTPIPVDSKLVIRYSGATHCVSMQVPR